MYEIKERNELRTRINVGSFDPEVVWQVLDTVDDDNHQLSERVEAYVVDLESGNYYIELEWYAGVTEAERKEVLDMIILALKERFRTAT